MRQVLLVISWLIVAILGAEKSRPRSVGSKKTFPIVKGAKVSSIPISGQYSIMEYEPESFNPSAVTRAIIVVHGKGRDAWKYYRAMQEAITESAVDAESIFILAPEFLTRQDLDLAQADSLIWNGK